MYGEYSISADTLLGVSLTLILLIGIPANVISLLYFSRLRNRNPVQVYFNRTYSIITLVDALLCFALCPIAEACLTRNRTGTLFSADIFCWAWAFVWGVLSIQSVFMIGVLSVSRLLLLLFPLKLIPAILATLIPAAYFLFIAGLLALLLALDYIVVYYDTRYMFCTFSGLPLRSPGYVIQSSDLRHEQMIRYIWVSLTGLPVFPIICSFLLSVYCLHRTKRRASRHGNVASTRRQERAAGTILVVTLLYIVWNIPAFVVVMVTVRWRYNSTSTTIRDMYTSLYKYYSSNFLFYYAWFIACPVSIGMNSLLNPAVYYWRIGRFRKFLARRPSARECTTNLGIRHLARQTAVAKVKKVDLEEK